MWDDWGTFVTEPLVRRWEGIVPIWFSPSELKGEHHYWPLVYTSFWLEHKLWGFLPAGHHAVNLVLHAVNVLLAWRVLRRLDVPGAWLAAALFAVHPVHVESVAWIIERKDLLSALFYLAAALAWLRYAEAPGVHAAAGARTPRHLVACMVLLAAALLSKSVAVTLPAALLLLQWWRMGRVGWRDVGAAAPLFVLAAGIAAADLWFYRGNSGHVFDYSVVERALIAARAVALYAGQLVWPAPLPVLYPRWPVDGGDLGGWLALGALGALGATLWAARRGIGRGPLAAVAFFVLTLAPVLGFVDFSFMRIAFAADRFQYLASLGPLALAAAAAMRWSGGRHALAVAAGVAGVLALLGTLTWRQSEVWRDDLTLARHAAAASPGQYFGQVRLAWQLIAAGDGDAAIGAARRAVRLAAADRGADLRAARRALGNALLAQDRPFEAEQALRRALADAADGRHNGIRLELARALVRQGRLEQGLAAYREVLSGAPDDDGAHLGLGEALFDAERWSEAADALRRALPLLRDPTAEPFVHRLLGQIAHRQGRLDAAAAHLDQALAIHPRNVWTLLARAAVAVEQGGGGHWLDQARERSEAALAREPDNALARVALGAVLLRQGEHGAALEALEPAIGLARSRPVARQAHRAMGAAFEARREWAAAAAQYGAALDLYALDADALERLGALHHRQGRYAASAPLYRRLLWVRPGADAARARLVEALRRLGRRAEADALGAAAPDGT